MQAYDYVIDGANVLFYIDRKICLRGYARITKMLNTLAQHKPGCKMLLVIHQRHFKQPDKWRQYALNHVIGWHKIPGLSVCRTPPHLNDDYYSLLNAIPRTSCYLITNDKFRDHIFKLSTKDHALDLIAQWRKEKVIEYDFVNGEVEICEPMGYSFRVQKVNNSYYLPVKSTAGSTIWYMTF